MDTKLFVGSFCCILLLLLFYSSSSSQLVLAKVPNWKKFSESAHKFRFFYPPDWQIRSRHDNITGSSEIILIKPNSSRTQVSILYNPNDALLTNAKTGKPIIPSKALAQLEEQISLDYIFLMLLVSFHINIKFTIISRQAILSITIRVQESRERC
jgi:hypothetical protein